MTRTSEIVRIKNAGTESAAFVTAPFTLREVSDLIWQQYGIASSVLRHLAGERDQIFQVSATDGKEFLLKIYASSESVDAITLESGALMHLASRDAGIPVQRVIPALNGGHEAVFRRGAEPVRIAKLLDYLPGALLAPFPRSQYLRIGIGTLLARIDRALEDFPAVVAERKLIWDLQRAGALTDKLSFVTDTDIRHLAASALSEFNASVVDTLMMLPRQAIHNDLTPFNILVDPSAPSTITGIIDFGDMVFAPRVCDLAIAVSYHVADGETPLSAALEIVRAFHRVNPLDRAEQDILFALIKARMAATIVITEWRATVHPENRAYIIKSQPASRSGLLRLASISENDARREIHAACEARG